MAMLCAIVMTMGACSSDNGPDTPESQPVKPDNWESELYPKNSIVCNPAGSLSGTEYNVLDYGIAVEDKNREYFTTLFKPGTEKEYYVEYDGRKYFLGDTVPIPGNNSPVRLEEIAERGGIKLIVTNFGSYHPKPEWFNHEPIEYGYTFVWPEHNIRTHIEVYIKFNPNYIEEGNKVFESLKQGEIGYVTTYWVGEWIDGVSLENKFYHAYVIKR